MSQHSAMNLQISLPHHVLINASVTKLIAEGAHGSFCLLPNHIDCLSILEPGIFIYEETSGIEHYIAVGQGLLVKQDVTVSVAAWDAIAGDDLSQLQQAVEQQFRKLDKQAQLTQSALARLEAGLSRNFGLLIEGG